MLRSKRVTSYSDPIQMILHPDAPRTPLTPEPLSAPALYSTPVTEVGYSYMTTGAIPCVSADNYSYTPIVQEAVTEWSRLGMLQFGSVQFLTKFMRT